MDIVLNSLAGDKLFASVRVLAKHGRFLEIGKYDLANNSALGEYNEMLFGHWFCFNIDSATLSLLAQSVGARWPSG